MVLEGAGQKHTIASDVNGALSNGIDDLNVSTPELKSESGISHESQLLTVQTLRALLQADEIDERTARAIALHSAFLLHLPLAARRVEKCGSLDPMQVKDFEKYCTMATRILRQWQPSEHADVECNISDLVDGRLLGNVLLRMSRGFAPSELDAPVMETFEHLESLIGLDPYAQTSGLENGTSKVQSPDNAATSPSHHFALETSLMPFRNPLFDTHLESVHIPVDKNAQSGRDPGTARIFQELTHWHNTRPLAQKSSAKAPVDPKQHERAIRRNQFFMKDMTTYAASLTNAVGKMLEPEVVIVDKEDTAAKKALKEAATKEQGVSGTGTQKGSSKQTTSKKNTQKSSRKDAMMQDIAVESAKKRKVVEDKYFGTWAYQLAELQRNSDLAQRYQRALAILVDLGPEKGPLVGPEIRLYLLDTLLRMWSQFCKEGKQKENLNIAALMWNHINTLLAKPDWSTPTILQCIKLVCASLGFLFAPAETSRDDRKLSFTFLLSKTDSSIKATQDFKTFQLEHCGPFMDRSIDSAPDARTRFDPDGWQREVLDTIDANKSLFVVAPTSAGKTFISFYAMKKTLLADNDGVIVYVAPTKALVNQIAAEIQANFSKTYKTGGKSVWAIHTRDYRINSPVGCQVLVTVPHILQIMLLSPSNAVSWSSRVKRIIFDEIHSIGQAEDGIVWEQLLLLAPCPIIALSATVGNPHEFSDWLASTQRSLNNELRVVIHPHRYSDLRKYVYKAPKKFTFEGLSANPAFGELGLEKGAAQFPVMHPVSSLVHKSQGVPEDLSMEPRDCLVLWTSFKKHGNEQWPMDPSLDPTKFFGDVIRKRDVIAWEAALKAILKRWLADQSSPFDAVLEELSRPLHDAAIATIVGNDEADEVNDEEISDEWGLGKSSTLKTTMPLLVTLQSRGALPAILFNYDRTMCEKIGEVILADLVKAEQEYKENDSAWKRKLSDWEKWKKLSAAKKAKKPAAPTKGKNRQEDDPTSKADSMRDNAETEIDPLASFDPEAPLGAYSFANNKVLQASELGEHLWKLERRHIAPQLLEGIKRGVGIHHAGMNRAYRQAVEVLFRKGFLRVVIATGTLALGINMPCKTVVFSGDSVFLTALNFRQCAGRAGRRGFDLLGNVVFQGLPLEKARRLVSSRLPSLNGHFPITTSLVLRLFILLHESKEAAYSKKAINSLLSQPRLYLGGQSFKDQVLHHLRFSIEYLRRSSLLNFEGAPLNFAGTVSHLYFTENSSFALHALIKGGYFHRRTADLNDKNSEQIMRTMMLTMSHLFGRRPCRQADMERENYEKRIKGSPSVVFMPPMPDDASRILREHNQETLSIFSTYVRTFAEQHMKDKVDNVLPFTNTVSGSADAGVNSSAFLRSLPPTTVRSHFVALSGHSDEFATIPSLCRTARSGVFLEESVIPYVPVDAGDYSTPLNAYLLDFYKHSDVTALSKANGIRRGEVWFLLNDFSMVLATIVAALKNLMHVGENEDPDLMDLQAGGDLAEETTFDTQLEALEQASAASSTEKEIETAPKAVLKPKKKVVTDSWDDEGDEEDDSDDTVGQSSDVFSSNISYAATNVSSRTSVTGDSDQQGAMHKESLGKVLVAFERLKVTFDAKFRAMWA